LHDVAKQMVRQSVILASLELEVKVCFVRM